jgi:hypothetical protein
MQALFEKIGHAKYTDRQANTYTISADEQRRDISVLTVELGTGSLAPSDLADMCTVANAVVLREAAKGSRCVSLSGRLPTWAVAAIHHALKPSCDTLYQYDPKLGHLAVMQHRGHVAIGAVVS